jgi:16S rRNA G966 N2-methylase RsmD
LGRNLLFYGDNLDVLRNRIPSASVDLIHLDPPFNSNLSYKRAVPAPQRGRSPS